MDPKLIAAHYMEPTDVTPDTVGAWRSVLSFLANTVAEQCDELHGAGVDHDRTRALLGWVSSVRVELEGPLRPTKTAALIEEGRDFVKRLAFTRKSLPPSQREANLFLRRFGFMRRGWRRA